MEAMIQVRRLLGIMRTAEKMMYNIEEAVKEEELMLKFIIKVKKRQPTSKNPLASEVEVVSHRHGTCRWMSVGGRSHNEDKH
ncbi:hypothetical protein DY000_02034154 [Brassica cretica]|uniref:Rx N-terminal domain-containing protein n=1 Tax=Brassica cretica TaxID=69181 RepID=A0ABQ7E1C4_BRACR|nr:hypothetical protein DY000_02034154 [Brassica cretica]